MSKYQLRRLRVLVTPMTMQHLNDLALAQEKQVGQVVDDMVMEHCAAARRIKKVTYFDRVDEDHNVYQCSACGHLARFEADGPYENGWAACPHCLREIEEPRHDPRP